MTPLRVISHPNAQILRDESSDETESFSELTTSDSSDDSLSTNLDESSMSSSSTLSSSHKQKSQKHSGKGVKSSGKKNQTKQKSKKKCQKKMTLKPIPPTKYDRAVDLQKFHRFITEGTTYICDGQVPMKKCVFILSHYLTGQVHEFYTCEVAGDPYQWHLLEFFKELFNYCFPIDFHMKQWQKLLKCYQNDQGVQDFLYDLNELWNMIGETEEPTKVNKFWFGLWKAIQQDLWLEKLNPEVSRLKEVVSAAEIIEMSQSVMNDVASSNSQWKSCHTESAINYKKRKNKNWRYIEGKRNFTLYPDSETLETKDSGDKPQQMVNFLQPGYKKFAKETNSQQPKMSCDECE